MATVNLGRIKPVWKGAYSAGTAYIVDDVVSYNSSTYICTANSTGNLPTDTSYWDVMAAGFTGDASTITTGTIPDAVFPSTLPAISGANLTGVTSFPKLVGLFYKDATQGVSSGSYTRIIWDGSDYDPDSIMYNNDQIRPVSQGYYKFEWRLQMSQADMNKGILQKINKNGSTYWLDNRPAGNDTDAGGGGPHGAPICQAYVWCGTPNSDVFDININQASGGRNVWGLQQTGYYESQLLVYKMT